MRRVRHPAERISADPRARRRRTLDKHQLQMVLDGQPDHAYGYSVILTTSTATASTSSTGTGAASEGIEDRFRDAKLGYGLRHLPPPTRPFTQLLAGQNRRHAERLRHDWLRVPGRVLRHARTTILRLPTTAGDLVAAHARRAALPAPSG